MIAVSLAPPWLEARLSAPMRVLSWAPCGAGWRLTDRVLWREVRDADLGPDVDAFRWLAGRVGERLGGYPGGRRQAAGAAVAGAAVAMMTSCDIRDWQEARAEAGGVCAQAVVTLGLSNAESVGARLSPQQRQGYGTINLLVATDASLSRPAQIEAMSIAAQARTAALMECDLRLATGRATGTGTDCIALACPPGGRIRHAGLHTAAGEAIGAAARAAVAQAAAGWLAGRERRQQLAGR